MTKQNSMRETVLDDDLVDIHERWLLMGLSS